jgi:UDP-N-acetylglucosamine 2-epimerase (non-hydrolysing)
MRPNQTLAGLTARLVGAIDGWLGSAQPGTVLVQGEGAAEGHRVHTLC